MASGSNPTPFGEGIRPHLNVVGTAALKRRQVTNEAGHLVPRVMLVVLAKSYKLFSFHI
ncbi:hypothetical protein COLO4_30646 [Corchorus olitorius]|uniref:Uncharacterized protein n=1 Tax=Corchorus olitorius TaxID=93759 RepID=A0A1R3H7K1_9ROSI|nr:hypothetical protein COLO4_30646 [Corchorus olitorius]